VLVPFEIRLYSRHLNAYFVVCPSLFFRDVAFVVTISTFLFLSHADFMTFCPFYAYYSIFVPSETQNKSPDLFVSGENITLLFTLLTTSFHFPFFNVLRVKSEGSGCVFFLETDDVDGAIAKAVGAGAVADGDVTEVEGAGRVGKVKDPYGYVWAVSSPAKKAVVDVEA